MHAIQLIAQIEQGGGNLILFPKHQYLMEQDIIRLLERKNISQYSKKGLSGVIRKLDPIIVKPYEINNEKNSFSGNSKEHVRKVMQMFSLQDGDDSSKSECLSRDKENQYPAEMNQAVTNHKIMVVDQMDSIDIERDDNCPIIEVQRISDLSQKLLMSQDPSLHDNFFEVIAQGNSSIENTSLENSQLQLGESLKNIDLTSLKQSNHHIDLTHFQKYLNTIIEGEKQLEKIRVNLNQIALQSNIDLIHIFQVLFEKGYQIGERNISKGPLKLTQSDLKDLAQFLSQHGITNLTYQNFTEMLRPRPKTEFLTKNLLLKNQNFKDLIQKFIEETIQVEMMLEEIRKEYFNDDEKIENLFDYISKQQEVISLEQMKLIQLDVDIAFKKFMLWDSRGNKNGVTRRAFHKELAPISNTVGEENKFVKLVKQVKLTQIL